MTNSILIIDDEESMTTLLQTHFKRAGFLTYVANDERKAFEYLNRKIDIILLYINMPDMNGIEFCKNIREHISCPIIFLTAKVSEADKISGLLAGGDDYITKPFSLRELTARVEAHLRREQRTAKKNNLISIDGLLINLTEKKVEFEGTEISFSKTEYDLLSYLAINRGHTLDRDRIYESVWGYDALGDSTVIKEHIRRIRKKLMESTGREFIETVWGMGYRFRG